MPGEELLLLVEAHLLTVLGQDSGRAAVAFLGTERIDVLRFGPDPQGLVRYATLGMSRHPMADPGAALVASHGPRAELLLSIRGRPEGVVRRLAALAASPAVEGVVIGPGAGLDLAEPLWDGAPFTAVLVGDPGLPTGPGGTGLVPDLPVDGDEPVRFLPLLPMTPAEAAFKRVHGPAALRALWASRGTDLEDPRRSQVRLERPA